MAFQERLGFMAVGQHYSRCDTCSRLLKWNRILPCSLWVITDIHRFFWSIRSRVQALLFYYKPVFSVVISSTRGDDLAQTEPTESIYISKDIY